MTTPTGFKTTIGDLLDRQAEQFGDNDALIHVDWDVRYTYREFRAECDRVARGLMALGINKGDHVGIWATNYPEWVVAQFATAKIGAVLVTVNPAYRTHELEYLLQQSDVAALILIGNFRTSDYVAMLGQLGRCRLGWWGLEPVGGVSGCIVAVQRVSGSPWVEGPDSYSGKREAPGLLVLGPLVWLSTAAVLVVLTVSVWTAVGSEAEGLEVPSGDRIGVHSPGTVVTWSGELAPLG